MEELQQVIHKLRIKMNVWTNTGNENICVASNTGVKGEKLDNYCNRISYGDELSEIINSNTPLLTSLSSSLSSLSSSSYVHIHCGGNEFVEVGYIVDKYFVEVRYPHSNMLSIINQKIRDPLNGLIGVMAMMDGTPLSPEQKNYLNLMKLSSCDLICLVNDLVDIINIQQNRHTNITPTFINIEDLLNRLYKMCDGDIQYNRQNIKFQIELEGNVPKIMKTDEEKLYRALEILVRNSVQHTEMGGVVVNIGYHNGFITFRVKDTGCGLNDNLKEYVDKLLCGETINIFHDTISGFGLYICYHIVKALGGDLQCKSEEGIGTIFNFEIDVEAK
jgi:signal transduction histidine kinase